MRVNDKTRHLFISQFENAIKKRHIFIRRLVVEIFTFHNAALKRNESYYGGTRSLT